MNRYEQARRERMATDPDYAARRRHQNNRPRPNRPPRPEHDNRYRRTADQSYVIAPVDGEGFEFDLAEPLTTAAGERVTTESRYCLLQIAGTRPLWNQAGIGTAEALRYLLRTPPGWALVGYGLTYDCENILRDLPDADYLALCNGGDEVEWEGFTIKWIPRRLLSIAAPASVIHAGGDPGRMVKRTLYDALSWYQTTLVGALAKAKIPIASAIVEGKAARGGFRWEDRFSVAAYNRAELAAMRALFAKLRADLNAGLEDAKLPFAFTRRDWYGPGSLAKKLLKHMAWTDEHPLLNLPEAVREAIAGGPPSPPADLASMPYAQRRATIASWSERQRADAGADPVSAALRAARAHWRTEHARRFPFSCAYFGGRIEAAATGRFENVIDLDLHSAYPTAMTRLPTWTADAGLWYPEASDAQAAATAGMLGMFLVEWDWPEGWDWYPLPYRASGGNVYYPRTGAGWVMSCELYAAVETAGWSGVAIHQALVLAGTSGCARWRPANLLGPEPLGLGTVEPPEGRRSMATVEIRRVYAARERMVAARNPGEKAVKLALNSSYGKLWQQVGVSPDAPGLFGDLAGAWVTAWTRASVWRRLWGHHTDMQTIAIQTDGLAGTWEPSPVGMGPGLGQWEAEELRDYRQFLPGVYDHAGDEGRRSVKRRGYSSRFDPEQAWEVVTRRQPVYQYSFRFFVGRRHALAQPKTWGDSRYQWRDAVKRFTVALGSKRTSAPDLTVLEEAWAKEQASLARQLAAEADGGRRDLLAQVRRVTGGTMIRPGRLTAEIPASWKRRNSLWSLDMIAAELGYESDQDMAARIADLDRRRRWEDPTAWEREAEAMLASDAGQAAAARWAREVAAAASLGAPVWTDPKPNDAWNVLGRLSCPYDLRFSPEFVAIGEVETPYADGESAASLRRSEDESGHEGIFVAGLRE